MTRPGLPAARMLVATVITFTALALPGAASAEAAPPLSAANILATAAPAGSSVSPAHAWADPTHPNDDGEITFGLVEIHFTPPTDRWVAHASAPRMTDGTTHCYLDVVDFGLTLACEGTGTPIPGEHALSVDVRTLGGEQFGWSIPMTVCPLTGCSDLFSLALDPAGWDVCAGDDLTAQGPVEFVYNVAWNASELLFGPIRGATGDWEVRSQGPANGGTFGIAGFISSPGNFSIEAVIVDEFGGYHEAALPIRVRPAGDCVTLASAPGLPPTGSRTNGTVMWMLALLTVGAMAVVVSATARRNRGGA